MRKQKDCLKIKLLNFFKKYFYKFELIFFFLILLARVYYALNHVSFSQDQARDLFLIEELISKGKFFVEYGSKTSIGNFFVFPFYYQLMLIIQRVFNHPLGMYLFVTVAESFTPVILFILLRKFFTKQVALLSSIIYAFSSLVILYSTSAWSPNLIPVFFVGFLYLLISFLIDNNRKHLFISVVIFGLMAHFHFQVFVLTPLVLLIFTVSLKRSIKNIWLWIAGSCIASISYLPYLMAEVNSGWSNTLEIYNFFFKEHSLIYDRVSKLEYVFTFFPAFFERFFFRVNFPAFYVGRSIFFLGMIRACYVSYKEKKHRWLLLIVFVMMISLRFFKGDKLDYYLMVYFYLPVLLLAYIIEYLGRWKLLLLIPLFLILGYQFSAKPFNHFKDTADIFKQLSAQTKEINSAHLIIYNLDKANTYLYAFNNNSDIQLNRDSKVIIEICESVEQCNEAFSRQCYKNDVSTYVSYLKELNPDLLSLENSEIIYQLNGAVIRKSSIINHKKELPLASRSVEKRKDLINMEIN